MKIHFLGGTETVTGSKFLIETSTKTILIDCGMFQGEKALRELNRQPLSFLPENIDVVLITHGHLDHCGWLPLLVKNGFKGAIYCTFPTKDIIKLILEDSAKIQEEEAEKANKEKYSKHDPAEPLYTLEDVYKVIPLLKAIDRNEIIKLEEDIIFKYFYAGHILGACSIELIVEGKTLIFSGDIGQDDDVLMYPPVKPHKADFVFLESTYGDRNHPEENTALFLKEIIWDAYHKRGNVVIPSFAVERVQTLMYLLWELYKKNELPPMEMYIDTPMGINVIEYFYNYPKWHKLLPHECEDMCKIFNLVSDFKETIGVVFDKKPKLVIAASGMITGGRVLTYLEKYISLPETKVILVGYQAEGTRGRKLLDGEKQIKIYGKFYPVHAEIHLIESLSAHADQKDLINWLADLENIPQKLFLIHGEKNASESFKNKLNTFYKGEIIIPKLNQVIEIS